MIASPSKLVNYRVSLGNVACIPVTVTFGVEVSTRVSEMGKQAEAR